MNTDGPKKRQLAWVILALTSLLSGCAGVATSKFEKFDSSRTLQLKDEFSYEAYYRISGVRWKHSFAAGLYTADRQDKDGVYYRGPRDCMSKLLLEAGWAARDELVGKIVSTEDCGIYIPNDEQQGPKVFVVNGSMRVFKGGKTPVTLAENPDPAQTQAMVSMAVPNATPIQAGVGGALGGAIVAAMIAAEKGNYDFSRDQPEPSSLRDALEFR